MNNTANTASRPNLEPLWTNYRNLGGMPKTAFKPATSPEGMSSPSPMSPKSLPSPMHPTVYTSYTTKQHERSMVNRFDSERSQPSSSSSAKSLRSIEEEETPLTARLERFSILPPLTLKFGLPSPPAAPPAQLLSPRPNRDSLHRARTLLEPKTVSIPQQSLEPSYERLYRRNSATTGARPLPPPPPPPRKQSVMEIRDQLRNWGHVYHGNIETADAFVIARSLRRQSTSPIHLRAGGVIGSPTSSRGASHNANRQTIRAIIRPKALERQSFLVQRTFDMDELRATIPDPVPHYHGALRPSPASFSGQRQQQDRSGTSSPSPAPRSMAAAASRPPRPLLARRRSSVRSSELLSGRGRASVSLDHEALICDPKTVPIHLKYARAYFPVLAALLVSGHVREGDIIYLPLPHPEVWPQTVRYIYLGQDDLSAAMRENILYLAGKV
ncbi:hypothetical protein PFICI_13621 [Pestalotiopsis fici W106-1]|uniref:Uncharacterized protein n=1 Tax=Pestalotiopsis fici (strain W106-1 / CGMCC3.15140) TaxID=1229662 RepID=W3WPQ7_PESFW|nr:uncharacterized protein PFICI_13621 [Pestalotiopsis fici W106-1]ETS75137.1 hypothetical protein PFICI_13621 [Pestalotiopsis fici W106-1]